MIRPVLRISGWFVICLFLANAAAAQTEEVGAETLPTIAEQPKTIDPGELLPPKLAATATQEFADSSLREVVSWLQEQRELAVLLDRNALNEIGISEAEPVSDRLNDAPVYLLLDRLASLGLGWYFEDDVLYITSADTAETHGTTQTYNVGSLLDAGYQLDSLEETIVQTVSPGAWEDVGGEGAISSLGDVLFVRQSDEVQRQVQALLKALATPARQTYVNDPLQHLALRDALERTVTADFQELPLEAAVARLSESAGIDIRLDATSLRDAAIRPREPVSLKLKDRKLETVLHALTMDLDLTWVIRYGVLWITSHEQAGTLLKTAVYDVRDLCRDREESLALVDAVTMQADPNSWDEVGGDGSIEVAKAGVIVIRQREQVHRKIASLLETYRSALRSSKPRDRSPEDADEITTVYYRLHAQIASDLVGLLPLLVAQESWQSVQRPDAPGTILLVSSTPELPDFAAVAKAVASSKESTVAQVIQRSVLIVKQTRAVHEEIREVIRRVENGDAQPMDPAQGMGMGGMGGGGGFGGGFF